jgi:tetratricopeptide (TPR) repeat protein
MTRGGAGACPSRVEEDPMRSKNLAKLLAGAALATLMLAAPSLSVVSKDPQARRGLPALDPLVVNREICRARAADGELNRRGLFIAAARAYAATSASATAEAPPLFEGVASGALEPTANQAALPYFRQGIGLMDGFNHSEAVRAFRTAQALDPDCALCFWGEAYALGPNINDAMDPANNARALETARLAREKAEGASEVERALIDTLQTRYSDDPSADRAALDKAYSAAMQEVADRFPEHDQVQALAAEAIMDAQPWDYWESGGRTPKGDAGVAMQRLETVLERNPDQVLAIHLYIHMTEASDDPWRAVEGAERLAGLAPGAGHLVHMPAHTWFRIGRFAESLEANIDAVAVDEAYLDRAGDAASDIYRYGYYPHNVHFVLTSAQMAGDGQTVLESADRLDAALPMDMAEIEGWIQLIKAAPWFAKVQFGEQAVLEDILAAAEPDGAPAYIEAAWRYARGEAAARLGRPGEARAEAAKLAELDAATDWDKAIPWMPGAMLVDIMQETVLARAAMAENDLDTAIDHWGRAAALQADLPYLEPPFWYYPARQSFAATLLRDGQAERAEQEFFATLVESPDNGWAYWGLAKAREAQGDATGAEAAMTMWRDAWVGEEEPSLERL